MGWQDNKRIELYRQFVECSLQSLGLAARLQYQMAMDIAAFAAMPAPQTQGQMAELLRKNDLRVLFARYGSSAGGEAPNGGGFNSHLAYIINGFTKAMEEKRVTYLYKELPDPVKPPKPEPIVTSPDAFRTMGTWVGPVAKEIMPPFRQLRQLAKKYFDDLNGFKKTYPELFTSQTRQLAGELKDEIAKATVAYDEVTHLKRPGLVRAGQNSGAGR